MVVRHDEPGTPAFPPSSTFRSDRRLPELDGIRGLAILMILIFHYEQLPLGLPAPVPAISLKAMTFLTWSGVDLFFVLSGFLIAGLLIDNRGATNYFRVFYLRRVCRTFPLYALLLATFLVLSHTHWAFSHR